MNSDRSERRVVRRAAKADKKRATAEANLSALPAGEPATPLARGFEACPCQKDCTLHGECLCCVAYHGSRSELPRCLR